MMVDESERERAKSAFADPTQYLRNNSYITLRAQAVRRMVAATSAKSILDLWCVDCRISFPLVGDADELLLVDASKGMLELAVQHFPAAMVDRVHFKCRDIATFEPTRQIDLVICIDLLAHVPYP